MFKASLGNLDSPKIKSKQELWLLLGAGVLGVQCPVPQNKIEKDERGEASLPAFFSSL